MILNPAALLNPVFNYLNALIENYGIYCYLVFVWLSLAAITGVSGGGLRRNRSQGNSATIIPAIIITTRPRIQPSPSIIITDFDPAQNGDNEIMDEP
jgi:hypothetical protein